MLPNAALFCNNVIEDRNNAGGFNAANNLKASHTLEPIVHIYINILFELNYYFCVYGVVCSYNWS